MPRRLGETPSESAAADEAAAPASTTRQVMIGGIRPIVKEFRFYRPAGPPTKLILVWHPCANDCGHRSCTASERGFAEYCCRLCAEKSDHSQKCDDSHKGMEKLIVAELSEGDELDSAFGPLPLLSEVWHVVVIERVPPGIGDLCPYYRCQPLHKNGKPYRGPECIVRLDSVGLFHYQRPVMEKEFSR